MYKSQKELLNRGKTVKLPKNIKISSKDLIAISKFPSLFKKELEEYNKNAMRYIKSVLNDQSIRNVTFDFDFLIKSTDDGKENQLVLNPYSIIEQIMSYLNLTSNPNLKNINSGIESLRNCRKLGKGLRSFPKLYDLYCIEVSDSEMVKRLKDNKKNVRKYFPNCVDKNYLKSLESPYVLLDFEKNYSSIFESLISHFSEIREFFYFSPFEVVNSDKFKSDEFEFLVAKGYLNCIKSLKDTNDIQKYMIYLNSYFNEYKDLLGKNKYYMYRGKSILFDSLYDEYLNVLSNNPDISFNNVKDYKEAESIIKEKDDISKTAYASWSFLDKDSPFDNKRVNRAIDASVKNIKDESERELAKEKIRELFYRKVMLFDNLNYYKKVMGLNRFSGYVAYIFNNGNVILEKFFDLNSNGEEKIAHDEAVYVMSIDEFLELSSISKQEIISNKLCKRINHIGDFESRVIDKANEEGMNPEPKYLELVKKGYIKER